MNSPDTASLFEEEPHTWGLRGDPHLWREMREATVGLPLSPTSDELRGVLEGPFEQLTGGMLVGDGEVLVERHAHGGMSSGQVSCDFWRSTAIPLLERRWEHATSGAPGGYTGDV